MEIVIVFVLAYFNKHGPNPSYTEDRTLSSVSLTLSTNFENLVLTGTNAINGTGNSLANRITGNSADNILDGRAGADILIGGLGNDTYITDGRDRIIEGVNEGVDTVRSSANIVLSANVEHLFLTGTSAINGIGNGLNNRMVGNAAANILTGGAGNDSLLSASGADSLIGGTGRDILNGGVDTHRDVFIFLAASESRIGSGNRDIVQSFVSGRDDINLSAIDANTARAGDQAFGFNGTTARANSIWYLDVGSDLVIQGDVNGDRIADFEIQVSAINILVRGDFLL